jgi:AAA domain-containing protein/bifunctional DNA primase/polymerase-like protein
MAEMTAAAPAASVFDDYAPLYRAAGFRVVPIAPNTKYPGVHQGFGSYIALVGWPTSNITDPQPGAGIGLICGEPLIAADIDSDDEGLGIELIDALTDGCGTTITKTGKRGQTLLLRPPPDVKVRSRKFLINGATAFEMLAEGRQTVLPPTVHPDLKAPYRWGNGATPLNTELQQIAVLRSDWEERVETVLAKYGYEPEPPKDEQRAFDDTSPFQQMNNLAMANLPEWVPALNLYNCRRGRGFQNYEAIAIWRSSQNPLEERRTNLKISSKGIVDFGTGKGYSPLDLVMASRACTLNEAFDWLTTQLGPGKSAPVGAQVVDLQETRAQSAEAPQTEPQQPRGYRFKLVAFDDMKPGLEQLYLVDELIPVAGLVDIWGKPKCFKSFWTLDLMFHVAMGWEYRDRSVQQGAVIYCAFEGAHGYKKRIEAIRRHYELEDGQHVPLYIMPGQANLIADHKTLVADITGQLNGIKPICVVLDTLNKSLMGSESKDTDMSAYVRAAEAIRDAFKCVVIIVHHCGLDDTRPRGHTALPGAVDAQLAVVRERNAVTVTVEMMRDGPEETVVTSMVEVIEVGQDHAGKVLTSLVVKPGETPAGGNMGIRWTGALTIFRRALCEALSGSEEKLMVGGIPVRAVDLEAVRSEFYKTCVAHADGTDEKQDTRKKRFYRAVERAQVLSLIGVRVEPSGRTLVWLAEAQAYAG